MKQQIIFLLFSGISQETLNQSVGSSRANSLPRPLSPSPSLTSEKHETAEPHVSRNRYNQGTFKLKVRIISPKLVLFIDDRE